MAGEKVEAHKSSLGSMDANIMALLCYLSSVILSFIPVVQYVAWVAPLVLYFLEKQSGFVKFHAMQAFILNLISWVLSFIVSVVIGGIVAATMMSGSLYGLSGGVAGLGIITLLSTIIMIVFTVFDIIAMVKAYNYAPYKIPVVGNLAVRFAKTDGK